MSFILVFTEAAIEHLKHLKKNAGLKKQYKAVTKALELLQQNPRHPGLQTHPYYSLRSPEGKKVFEAYAEQKTPSAYRVFFYYGPHKGEITVFAIVPHP